MLTLPLQTALSSHEKNPQYLWLMRMSKYKSQVMKLQYIYYIYHNLYQKFISCACFNSTVRAFLIKFLSIINRISIFYASTKSIESKIFFTTDAHLSRRWIHFLHHDLLHFWRGEGGCRFISKSRSHFFFQIDCHKNKKCFLNWGLEKII